MKVVRVSRFGGPEVLETIDLPDPVAAGEQILVKLEAVGVNPVETYIRSGVYPRLPGLPYVPGSDGAGIVVKTGQRVYLSGSLSGTYASLTLAHPEHVHPLPDRLSFEQGAALGVPYATAYHALFHKAGAQPGQRILIRGASGSVGLAALQLARAHGCHVAGTASTAAGQALLAQHGCEEIAGHDQTTGPYDVILEMHANTGLQTDLEQCAPRGTIVVIGNRGRIEIDPRLSMTGDLTIRGLALANATFEEQTAIHDGLARFLASESVNPVVRATYPLEDAAAAHQQVMQRGALGKIVLIP